jgi:hypothetical protein
MSESHPRQVGEKVPNNTHDGQFGYLMPSERGGKHRIRLAALNPASVYDAESEG